MGTVSVDVVQVLSSTILCLHSENEANASIHMIADPQCSTNLPSPDSQTSVADKHLSSGATINFGVLARDSSALVNPHVWVPHNRYLTANADLESRLRANPSWTDKQHAI